MGATIDTDLLVAKLKDLVDAEEFQVKWVQFKALQDGGINPFKYKPDTTDPVGWAKYLEAQSLLNDILVLLIRTVEQIVADAGAVAAGKEKLDAVVKILDDIIQLPFYIEWLDDNIIRIVITQIVSFLNKKFGTDWIQHIPVPTN